MMIARLLLAAGLGLLPASASALAEAPANADTCANATSQMQLNICADAGAKQADAALNRAYRQVMMRLSPGGKVRLRDAQRAWLVYRDKQCTFESNGSDGGSVSPMVALNCRQAVTTERTKTLAALRTCAEGDVSCPR